MGEAGLRWLKAPQVTERYYSTLDRKTLSKLNETKWPRCCWNGDCRRGLDQSLTCNKRPSNYVDRAEREREKREKKKRKLEQAEAEHDHLISRTTTALPYCKLWLAGKCQPGTRRCAKRHGTDDEADEIMCASVTEPPFRCPGIDCIFAHGDKDVLQRKIGPMASPRRMAPRAPTRPRLRLKLVSINLTQAQSDGRFAGLVQRADEWRRSDAG